MEPIAIGSLRVSRVLEWYGPTRPTWLLPDATREAVAAQREWLAPHFLDDKNRFLMAIQAFVVRAPGLTMLVDPCVGNDKPRANPSWAMLTTAFPEDLGHLGVSPEAVDVVVCTHLHVDHVGWNTRLVDGRWLPTFPRARYLFARREWEHWSKVDDEEYAVIMADSIRPVVDAGLVDLVEADHRISDEIRLEPSHGHTPGHVSVRVASGGREAVITGDLMHHPIQCAEPRWNSAFCVDAGGARAARRAFLERYADRDVLVLGTHFAAPAGRLTRHGDAWRFRVA